MDSLNVGLSSATISGDQKLIIHQKIPDGIVKRGPHAIVRSAQLNDCIEIQRRCGEGSKPLFDRDDITVNKATSHDPNTSSKSKTIRRSLSTESSSPERYRHRDVKKRSSPLSDRRKTTERSSRNERSGYNNDKHSYNIKYSSSSTTKTDKSKREKAKSPSPSFAKKKPVEKLPYYRDERREKDRLRRLYGRSRSRSPPTASFVRRYSPPPRRRDESPSRRRRSISRDRYRKYSPSPRSSRRDYNRARRSRSRSRTHSPHRRERHKRTSRSSRERDKAQDEDPNTVLTTITQPTPQFIPIPIAVPADYTAYSFHGWPTPQPPWHSTQHRPPPTSHFAPIPMLPMMAPLRPPPQSSYPGMPTPLAYAPIAGPPYRPHIRQRYPPPKHNSNNYQARARKPTS